MSTLNVEIPSLKSLAERLTSEDKLKAAKVAKLLAKKELKISSQVKQAAIAKMEAQDALETALIDESEYANEAKAVRALQDATDSYNFYNELYNKLFPNGSQSSAAK